MKTLGPVIVGIIAGWFGFLEIHIVDPSYRTAYEAVSDFAIILSAVAFILGGVNVIQVNVPKIRRRELDWQYKLVLLGSAVIMGLAGIAWHNFGAKRDSGAATTQSAPTATAVAPASKATLTVHAARKRALVVIDGALPLRAWHSGDPRDIWSPPGDQPLSWPLEPGDHSVTVQMPVVGYDKFVYDVKAAAPGQNVEIKTDLVMQWGAKEGESGRVYTWLYDYVFAPCNATMFALLAFFIASAAFRAFRARNVESGLLLGAAIFVMVGLVPMGAYLSQFFPDFAEWILAVPNTAGRRAIMMGAALGAVATGLRVILGLERSHLGAE